MIVLDTHIWVWWVHGDRRWEVAKLVENNRLALPCPVEEWLGQALRYPGVQLLELTPRIAVEATTLPGSFHRDPADQLLVATARVHRTAFATVDGKILDYDGVEAIDLRS